MRPAITSFIAMLALAGCPKLSHDRPADNTRMRLRALATVLATFEAKNSRFPNDAEGLIAALSSAGVGRAVERELLIDGWNAPFAYRKPMVYSFGADGRDDGGAGDDMTMGSVLVN